jgi:hypothetical protein
VNHIEQKYLIDLAAENGMAVPAKAAAGCTMRTQMACEVRVHELQRICNLDQPNYPFRA